MIYVSVKERGRGGATTHCRAEQSRSITGWAKPHLRLILHVILFGDSFSDLDARQDERNMTVMADKKSGTLNYRIAYHTERCRAREKS